MLQPSEGREKIESDTYVVDEKERDRPEETGREKSAWVDRRADGLRNFRKCRRIGNASDQISGD